ncbi:MAG: tyrosine--tRNA ligase [Spirochaetales bacterium]|nr:tyrosine--tRNA ligase [Spirochaetales bacterium]
MAGAFDVLKERGFIRQCSDDTECMKLLNGGNVTFYAGFDPTGNSLHVGHLVPLFAMAHLQRTGHRPIALVGGGTARIGDPSGKTETRKMLSVDDIRANAESFKTQISRFIDFSGNKAIMVDNADWLSDLNYIDFLREIGRHFSVNRMLGFEAYKQRMETGLSFIEFNYQILQSYDFLVLFQKYGCVLQLGGDDQWGNIVSGIELIRRMTGKQAYALTSPLIMRSDGKKMGKTEKGALYLDPELVSPYEFYQYWVNIADADVRKFLLLYTFLPVSEIEKLAVLKDKEANEAKKVLAFELTSIVHGKEAAMKVKTSSEALFAREGDTGDADAVTMDLSKNGFAQEGNIVRLFVASGLCGSTSEARRLIQQGGAYVNGENVTDIEKDFGTADLKDGSLLLRAGKKRYCRIVVRE